MREWSNIAIVGVGLIGGSIGMALRERGLAKNVVGIGRDQGSLRVARRVGAVTHTTIDITKGVADAELVILCTPVGTLVEQARAAAKHCPERTLLTDVGSVKRTVVEALDSGLARGCRFLGSHPLAGSEKAGAANASATLFEGRVAILTPTRNTRAEDFDLLEDFWRSVGSMVIQMSPEEHDQALAVTSHLPHLAAAARERGARGIISPGRSRPVGRHPRGRQRSRTVAADSHAQSPQRAHGVGAVRQSAGRDPRRAVRRQPRSNCPLSRHREEKPGCAGKLRPSRPATPAASLSSDRFAGGFSAPCRSATGSGPTARPGLR